MPSLARREESRPRTADSGKKSSKPTRHATNETPVVSAGTAGLHVGGDRPRPLDFRSSRAAVAHAKSISLMQRKKTVAVMLATLESWHL